MSRRRHGSPVRWIVAPLCALVAHALLWALLDLLGVLDGLAVGIQRSPALRASNDGRAATPPPDDRPLEIESLVDQLDQPDARTAEEKLREEREKKEQEDNHPRGQVVDVAKPLIEQRPDRADYVSEYDTKVDHETRGPKGRDHAGAL